MATRWAVATGNWSSPSTWDGLTTLPAAGDDVYADGKIVTIDQSVTVLSIRTTQRTGGTNAGQFNITPGITINATGTGLVTTGVSQNHFTVTAGTATTTINANITNAAQGGVSINASAFTGTLNVTGTMTLSTVSNTNVTGITVGGPIVFTGTIYGLSSTSGNSGGGGITSSAAGATITVIGNIFQGSSGGNSAPAVLNTSGLTAHITVTGNITGGTGSTGATAAAVVATGTQSNITVTGNVTGGTGPAGSYAIANTTASATKTISVIGTVTASIGTSTLGSHAIIDTNTGGGWTIVGGSLIDTTQGDCAINVRRFRCIPTLSTTRQYANNTGYPSGGMITYASLDYIPYNVPTPANVRSGIVYGDNGFTGTCAVPAAGSVALGIPVDNTTGTAVLTPAAVWNTLTSTMTTAGSIGERMKNAATVATSGDQLAAVFP